jgi:hypothetical protein
MMILFIVAWLGLANQPAVAATIVQVGSNVTAIDGIVINGVTYNVVFGTAVDTTFSTEAMALAAGNAIDTILNGDLTDSTVGPSDQPVYAVCDTNLGSGQCDAQFFTNFTLPPPSWTSTGEGVGQPSTVKADFTIAVSTPEPGTLPTVLAAGMLIWVAKRRSLFALLRRTPQS